MPAASEIEALRVGEDRLDDVRADPGQGEEAQHDARDAGQDLQDRLDGAAHPAAGVFGQVDRAGEADRCGDEHRDDRDDQRPGEDASGSRTAAPREPALREQLRQLDLDRNEIASKISDRTIPALTRIETTAAASRIGAGSRPRCDAAAAVPRSERFSAGRRRSWRRPHVVTSARDGGTGRTSELVRPVRGGMELLGCVPCGLGWPPACRPAG